MPVLAITSTQNVAKVGLHVPQVTDRSRQMNDLVRMSLQLPNILTNEDFQLYSVKVNIALLELRRHGGGPVHINLTTSYSRNFDVKELPKVRAIRRVTVADEYPAQTTLSSHSVAVVVGSHKVWSSDLTDAVDKFCEIYNAVVYCDHTSNYKGKYGISFALIGGQEKFYTCQRPDILIYIGEISAAYDFSLNPVETWRVSPDGEVRNPFGNISTVFEMDELIFFLMYASSLTNGKNISFYNDCRAVYDRLLNNVPELPFSNVWVAQQTCHRLPENSVLHVGILNSIRTWSFFDTLKSIQSYCNTGGFGIDGCVSSLIGASLAAPNKLFFGVVGDLAFFYDLNSIGNRHIKNNIRLIVVNNGKGAEFRIYNHPCHVFGDDADNFMAAAGHFGNKSKNLVRHYAEDLGFEYMSAENKDEYLSNVDRFVTPAKLERPIIFEVFTNSKDESDAVYLMRHIEKQSEQRQLSFPKPPIFCGTRDYANAVAMVFGGKYITLEDAQNKISVEKLVGLFNGNNFPVFFTDMFAQIKSLLEQNGLRENRDFGDGRKILRELF